MPLSIITLTLLDSLFYNFCTLETGVNILQILKTKESTLLAYNMKQPDASRNALYRTGCLYNCRKKSSNVLVRKFIRQSSSKNNNMVYLILDRIVGCSINRRLTINGQ